MEQNNNNAAQEAAQDFEKISEQPMENGGNDLLATVGAVASNLWAKKWVRNTVKVGIGALTGWIARGIVSSKKKED